MLSETLDQWVAAPLEKAFLNDPKLDGDANLLPLQKVGPDGGRAWFPIRKEDLPTLLQAIRDKWGEEALGEKKVRFREFL